MSLGIFLRSATASIFFILKEIQRMKEHISNVNNMSLAAWLSTEHIYGTCSYCTYSSQNIRFIFVQALKMKILQPVVKSTFLE